MLVPAFKRCGRVDLLPDISRWKCTIDLAAHKKPSLGYLGLDHVCQKLDLPMRDPDDFHNAYTDAQLAAELYMALMQLPEPKAHELGLVPSWEKQE